MPKFNKTNRTADDLIVVLKRKGLSIADEVKSINYIRNIGYYRLKAYFYPLYQEPKHKHLFKVDATFDKVMNMYRFDRKLRLLLFNEIEKIEVAFKYYCKYSKRGTWRCLLDDRKEILQK